MKPGYIYVLSNDSMPGVLKVGRTERQPEVRSKELCTTGVPQPFKLEHYVFVDDCAKAEQQIHALLEGRGYRTSANREFFTVSLEVAISTLDLIIDQCTVNSPNFRNSAELALLAASVPLPMGNKPLDYDVAIDLTARLAQISRKGYPSGMQRCAEIFEINCPSGPLFKQYWREFLELAKLESTTYNIASGGDKSRRAVGKNVAEYLARCHARGWLSENDFTYVSDFLVSGDRFQYEGYIDQIRRYKLPRDIMVLAESV